MNFVRPCPLCGQNDPIVITRFEIATFDQSPLDGMVHLAVCAHCGMGYTEVETPEILDEYYHSNTLYTCPQSYTSQGFEEHYGNIYAVVGPLLKDKNGLWIDGGCAQGGLLFF